MVTSSEKQTGSVRASFWNVRISCLRSSKQILQEKLAKLRATRDTWTHKDWETVARATAEALDLELGYEHR